MEIISFVQQSKKKRAIALPLRRKSINSVSYAYTYPSEKHIFKAGTVQKDITLKNCVASLGQGVSNFGTLIANNIKAIVISVFAIVGIAGLAFTAYFITDADAGVATVTYSYSATVTTDANGFFSLGTFDRKIIVLACWATQADVLIIPFPRSGSDANGQNYWWFKVLNENMAVRANFTLDFYMTYK